MREQKLSDYRCLSYEDLASRLKGSNNYAVELELFDMHPDDGGHYQIDVQMHWDDKPSGDIRVHAEILQLPLRPLWGFLPIYVGSNIDDFIMKPDGSCVDEAD